MLNREVGVIPTLSRSCNVEQSSSMSLGNWEDGASDDTEPEYLPYCYAIIPATDGKAIIGRLGVSIFVFCALL